MPQVDAALIDRLIGAFDPDKGALVVVPTIEGKRGNPVVWSRRFFPDLMAVEGDVGARHLIGRYAEAVTEVPLTGNAALTDVDTPEALAGGEGGAGKDLSPSRYASPRGSDAENSPTGNPSRLAFPAFLGGGAFMTGLQRNSRARRRGGVLSDRQHRRAAAAGAFAVGACGAYGYGFDFRKMADARAAAIKKCAGRDCRIVGVMRRSCAAMSVDAKNPCGPYGWAINSHLGKAENASMRRCYQYGGHTASCALGPATRRGEPA